MRKLLWMRTISLLALMLAPWAAAQAAESGSKPAEDPIMDFFKGEARVEFPPPARLLTNAMARTYRSLDGPWDVVLDEAGMSWNYITKGQYFDDGLKYPDTGMRLREISFDDRARLRVPGDWNSQRPDLDRYRGRVLYHRIVDIQPRQDERYLLYFDGANYTTDVFVNNRLVGRHTGGYTAFNFDITDFVVPGKNRLIVRVDAQLDETTIPTMRTSDFWKYGGLIREVGLVTVPETHVAQYQVYLHGRESREIRAWVQLEGPAAANAEVSLQIPAVALALSARSNAEGRAEFSARAPALELWSPDSPRLYEVAVGYGGSRIADRIGFRTIEVDGLEIRLNGEAIRLRGISMHGETIRHRGLSHSREDVRANFALVRELHANYVRLAHYPHSEHTVRLADEMGLMLWSEVPIVSLIDWDNPRTLAVATTQVSENIQRDMNRAAIIMWSVSNESFPQSEARLKFLGELARTARALDASRRPITSALVGAQKEEFQAIGAALLPAVLRHPKLDADARQRLTAMASRAAGSGAGQRPEDGDITVNISDPLGEVVDIVGYNEYFGWYYSSDLARGLGVDEGIVRDAMISIMPRLRFTNSFGKPMIISEFGASAKQGLRSKDALLWSEEYQARVFRAQLDMLDRSPFIQGYSPWVLQDFRSHLRELNGIQDGYNRKGLVSETGRKKLAFGVLSEHYRQQLR